MSIALNDKSSQERLRQQEEEEWRPGDRVDDAEGDQDGGKVPVREPQPVYGHSPTRVHLIVAFNIIVTVVVVKVAAGRDGHGVEEHVTSSLHLALGLRKPGTVGRGSLRLVLMYVEKVEAYFFHAETRNSSSNQQFNNSFLWGILATVTERIHATIVHNPQSRLRRNLTSTT